MVEPFDVTRPVRGVDACETLVRFVVGTDPKNETDWLEWKRGLDLSSADYRFEVARHILGFSNRHPDRAAAHVGGLGLLVLGAEPGEVTGQELSDNADFTNAMRSYLGAGPAWSPTWVSVDGKNVLVVTVEPPAWGDPPHPLRKGNRLPEGTVFVRRHGCTEQASAAEVDMLTARARLGASQLSGVEIAALQEPMTPFLYDEDAVQRWLDGERERLRAPLAPKETPQGLTAGLSPFDRLAVSGAIKAAQDVAKALENTGLVDRIVPEDRTEEEYGDEVEAYVRQCEEVLPYVLKARHILRTAPLRLGVRNLTKKNIAGLAVTVHLEGDVQSFEELPPDADLPSPPRLWGPRRHPAFAWNGPLMPALNFPSVDAYLPPGYTSRNGGSTTIDFEPIHLRPGATVVLPEVIAVTNERSLLLGSWEATSTGHDGVLSGTLSVPVSPTPLSFESLMSETEDLDPDEY